MWNYISFEIGEIDFNQGGNHFKIGWIDFNLSTILLRGNSFRPRSNLFSPKLK